MPNPTICVAVLVMCALTMHGTAAVAQDAESIAGEWRVYGSDKAGSKYSPLDQIDRDGNVEAWMIEAGPFGALRANGRDVTFPDGRRLFAGSSGTGAPLDGADPSEPVAGEQDP